jgi:hypothetical protein
MARIQAKKNPPESPLLRWRWRVDAWVCLIFGAYGWHSATVIYPHRNAFHGCGDASSERARPVPCRGNESLDAAILHQQVHASALLTCRWLPPHRKPQRRETTSATDLPIRLFGARAFTHYARRSARISASVGAQQEAISIDAKVH